VILDDDTVPELDLLFRYSKLLEAGTAEDVFGFAGVTLFDCPYGTLWTLAVKQIGMLSAFSRPLREPELVWAPTANMVLRRRERSAAAEAEAGAAAAAVNDRRRVETAALFLPPLLPECLFDEQLPKNGGCEDVDLCFRARAQGLRLVSAPLAASCQ